MCMYILLHNKICLILGISMSPCSIGMSTLSELTLTWPQHRSQYAYIIQMDQDLKKSRIFQVLACLPMVFIWTTLVNGKQIFIYFSIYLFIHRGLFKSRNCGSVDIGKTYTCTIWKLFSQWIRWDQYESTNIVWRYVMDAECTMGYTHYQIQKRLKRK